MKRLSQEVSAGRLSQEVSAGRLSHENSAGGLFRSVRSQAGKYAVPASFTVEAAYIFSIIFLAVAAEITFAFRERDRTYASFIVAEGAERTAHLEETYDPDGVTVEGVRTDMACFFSMIPAVSSGESDAERGALKGRASFRNARFSLKAARSVNSPETAMRCTTALTDLADTLAKEQNLSGSGPSGEGGTEHDTDPE